MSYKETTTHQVPVSLTHSERQRHFSFWPEWLDLWFGHRNHSQPIVGESWKTMIMMTITISAVKKHMLCMWQLK